MHGGSQVPNLDVNCLRYLDPLGWQAGGEMLDCRVDNVLYLAIFGAAAFKLASCYNVNNHRWRFSRSWGL